MKAEQRIDRIKNDLEKLRKEGWSSFFATGKLDKVEEYGTSHRGTYACETPTDLEYLKAGMSDATTQKMQDQAISFNLNALYLAIMETAIEQRDLKSDGELIKFISSRIVSSLANCIVGSHHARYDCVEDILRHKLNFGEEIDYIRQEAESENEFQDVLQYMHAKVCMKIATEKLTEQANKAYEQM